MAQEIKGEDMNTKAPKKADELEKAVLATYRDQVASLKLAALPLGDYMQSREAFDKLRKMRDQVDVCLGHIDEIRMALYKPPFGTDIEEDEEG